MSGVFPVQKKSAGFLRVKCACGNEQTIFSAATTKVKCLACGTQLAESTSSRVRVSAKVVAELN